MARFLFNIKKIQLSLSSLSVLTKLSKIFPGILFILQKKRLTCVYMAFLVEKLEFGISIKKTPKIGFGPPASPYRAASPAAALKMIFYFRFWELACKF